MHSSYYYCVGSLLVVILFSSLLLLNNNGNYFEKSYNNNNIYNNENDFFSFKFLQNSYAIEDNNSNGNSNEDNSDDNNKDKDDDASDNKKEEENNNKSLFNFVAVGDWDCNGETKDTVKNIIDQDPEVVLALGDLSYNGKAKCWLKLVEPIADKTKIVFGNHEDKLEDDYSEFFGLKEQYYSFNYKNVHFLALSTETDYDDESEQYQFAANDLEKYSKDPLIDWIIVFYHSFVYGSGSSLPEESDFRETYHPLFDKYKVDLALQGHFHVYERTYPISFNDDDDDEPIVNDDNPNIYKNLKGTVFVTVGTGGAQNMILSSREDFSAEGIDGKFGILDIALENDRHTLTGTFIENGKKKEVMDEFKIVK
ncbi:MAG TPA: metallophosphoesterase [Nitrososphaeraceae archaeon]|nr:metallophosphoesterase [Nitrososphaeraceae archaeon]